MKAFFKDAVFQILVGWIVLMAFLVALGYAPTW